MWPRVFNTYLCHVYRRVSGLRQAFDVFYLSRPNVFPATTVAQGTLVGETQALTHE